jgi:tetratricopeptide (TPR) repeat protein
MRVDPPQSATGSDLQFERIGLAPPGGHHAIIVAHRDASRQQQIEMPGPVEGLVQQQGHRQGMDGGAVGHGEPYDARPMSRHATLVLALRTCAVLAVMLLAACQGPPPTDSTIARANLLLEHDRCQEAADTIRPIVDSNPGSWGAQYAYGRAMVCLENLKEGRHALEIAVARNPGDLDVIFALADCMEKQGDTGKIYLLLRNAGAELRSPEAYVRLATIAERSNDLDSAKQALESAIEFDQGYDIVKSTEPYYRMAMLQAQLGDETEAMRRLRQAYGINPQDPRVIAALQERGAVLGPTLGLPRGQ